MYFLSACVYTASTISTCNAVMSCTWPCMPTYLAGGSGAAGDEHFDHTDRQSRSARSMLPIASNGQWTVQQTASQKKNTHPPVNMICMAENWENSSGNLPVTLQHTFHGSFSSGLPSADSKFCMELHAYLPCSCSMYSEVQPEFSPKTKWSNILGNTILAENWRRTLTPRVPSVLSCHSSSAVKKTKYSTVTQDVIWLPLDFSSVRPSGNATGVKFRRTPISQSHSHNSRI